MNFKTTLASGYVYAGEDDSHAIDILGEDALFMTNCDSYFLKGKKLSYPNGAAAYEAENGVVMVPADLLAAALDVNILCEDGVVSANGYEFSVGEASCDDVELDAAPCVRNGKYYIPIISFTQGVLKKYAYTDGRGFIIVSNNPLNYSNSEFASATDENSDIVCRYMQFERPDGEKIYADISKHSSAIHPRLFIRHDEISNFREKFEQNSDLKNELYRLLKTCESHINNPVVPYEFTQNEGPRLIGSFRKVRDVIFDLGVAYYATGNGKYLDRIWKECENVLSWQHWNMSDDGSGFLDACEVGASIAMAYDTLYDWLDDNQKNFFREKIQEKYLDYCVGVMEGTKTFKITDGRMKHSNWGAVCASSMLLTSMAFMDDMTEDSELTTKCKFISAGALRALEYPMGTLFPDGAINEGLEYWTFYVKNIALSIEALINMCGADYGFLSAPGLLETLNYALNMNTAIGGFNYSSTNTGESKQLIAELFTVANFYDDEKSMELLKRYFDATGVKLGAKGLLFYIPTNTPASFDDIALDNYFSGEKMFTMRSAYDNKSGTYVGISGGKNDTYSHFDKGSFIFEAGGERWFNDLGGERKDVYGGYYHAAGWNLYRKRTEGHNCVVINPYNNAKVTEFINNNIDKSYVEVTDDSRYTGQTIGGAAQVIRTESKPKGAIAVYDLSDVYGQQVNSYKRGFYLTDNRKSLILRDEIDLSSADSDIYWNLHTLGEIVECNKNGAIIEKNGKRLKVELITDIASYNLVETDAEPLDRSMIRATGIDDAIKEFSRDSYSKLMLSGSATGKIYISAKFSLENDENITPLNNENIDSWTIDDGKNSITPPIANENFKFTSSDKLVANAHGDITITADVPYKPQRLNLYINGNITASKSEDFNLQQSESFVVSADTINSSNIDIQLDYIYDGGTVSIRQNALIYTPYLKTNIIEESFESLTTSDTKRDVSQKIKNTLMFMHDVDGFEARGDGNGSMEILFNNAGENAAGFLYRDKLGIAPGNAINMKWSLTTNDFVRMYIEAKDGSGGVMTPSRIDNLPLYCGTHQYEMFLDGKIYIYSVYGDDGTLVHRSSGSYKSNDGGLSQCRWKFYSKISNSSLLLHDVSVDEYKYAKIFSSFESSDGSVTVRANASEDVKIIKAYYNEDGDELESLSYAEAPEITVDTNKICKIFAWNKNSVLPLCKPLWIK